MSKKIIISMVVLSSLSFVLSPSACANETKDVVNKPVSTFNKENLKLIKNNELTNDFLKIITFSKTTADSNIDSSAMYKEANDKFAQGNITSAYREYKTILQYSENEDFVNLGFAYKFANIGLFSLAQEAINNIKDRELYNNQIQLIKARFFPQVVLSYDDEILLAQNYTEIYYNNLAFEVARDMSKMPERFKRSDYAHYILSQAYYNIKEYNKAINEINKALSINPDNANYVKYKAQIYCETNKFSDAIKLLDGLIASDINILDYKTDLEGLRYYTLAKATKDREKSKYYLANYFIKIGDYSRAIKELNQNINADNKAYNSMTMLADIYFEKRELSQAMDLYEKSYKIKKNNFANLIGIANMYMFKKDYRNALDFYLKASKKNKDNTLALINASMCYKMLDMTDKSVEYANKAFAKEYVNPEVYYIASKIDDIKKIKYLKKTLSENPLHVNSWLDLTQISLDNNRLDLAQTYIKPVKHLDGNNAKYYYYLGLIEKKQGKTDVANDYFKKALQINPFLDDATKAMRNEL